MLWKKTNEGIHLAQPSAVRLSELTQGFRLTRIESILRPTFIAFFTLLFAFLFVWMPNAQAQQATKQDGQTLANTDNAFWQALNVGDAPMTTIAPANAVGREIHQLYALMGWISVAIFFLLAAIFVVIVIKFRDKPNSNPQEIHGNAILEVLWTGIPILILIVMAVPSIKLVFKTRSVPDLVNKEKLVYQYPTENNPAEQQKEYTRYLEVNVIGHQWWWEFEFEAMHERVAGSKTEKVTPIRRITANEPWLPTNIPIKFNIVSEDVIHSFWLPRLSIKLDALPGQVNMAQTIIEKPGYYFGQCVEYCGASHALMRFNVQAVSEEKFQQWLNWGSGEIVAKTETAKKGQEYFNNCLACHTLQGMKNYENRGERIAKDLVVYEQQTAMYKELFKTFEEEKRKANPNLHFRDLLDSADRPYRPEVPTKYKGLYKSIAPDLTDLRFRKKILAGIQENNKENLKRWIKNPAAQKPEIYGTPTVRMIAYEHIYSDEIIDNIIEFLMTLEYTSSPAPTALAIQPAVTEIAYEK